MGDTRAAVFAAAAAAFSARGFDGVRVEEIARAAGVNKAMLYYHFGDKLALYRAVVADMMREIGGRVLAIAEGPGEPEAKVGAVIDAFLGAAEARPWFPTLMLREVSDGAPHLDMETLGLMRNVFVGFSRVLGEGQAERAGGTHRRVSFCSMRSAAWCMCVRRSARSSVTNIGSVARAGLAAATRSRAALSRIGPMKLT